MMDAQAQEADLAHFEAALRTPRAIDQSSSRIRNVQVQPGLSVLTADLRLTKPALVESETFPAVCLSIVLEGYAEGRTKSLETGFRPGEMWVSSTNDRVSTRKIVMPAQPVRTVELVITPQWFEYAALRFGDDPAFDRMRAALERKTSTHKRPLDSKLRQLAWAIQNLPMSGAVASLYLESRTLDLLASLMAEFEIDAASPPPANLTPHTFDRVVAVRQKIDRDPGSMTTISALAAEFAVSPSKLKQDFATAFEVGLGRYIHDRRLLLGRELIEHHNLSISEAAYRSGYAHPANFTAAFRRRFGHPPSAVKPFS